MPRLLKQPLQLATFALLLPLAWQQPVLPSQSVAQKYVGREYYAAPTGAGGLCALTAPCGLDQALSGSVRIRPGDTLWLRGGTYHGTFTSYLQGNASAPITVRQMRGERAIIDGGNSQGHGILTIAGNYTWFWGFEIMSSDPQRLSSTTKSDPPDIPRGEGVVFDQTPGHGVGTKLINLVIHDTRQGVSFWKEARDAEIYGCIIFNNGWDGPPGDRGHGHGIYTQNEIGTKLIRNNIVFHQFGYGIHAYGSTSSSLDNFIFDGNILFENGAASAYGDARNVLVGGKSIPHNIIFVNNNVYGQVTKLGYVVPVDGLTLRGNYLVSDQNALELSAVNVTMFSNTYAGKTSGFLPADYPDNSYLSSLPPKETHTIVERNSYEPGRASIVVYNWQSKNEVEVDLSGVLKPGEDFRILDVQSYLGAPVLTGRFAGGPVRIPMTTSRPVSQPIGDKFTVPHTGLRFGVFVALPVTDR